MPNVQSTGGEGGLTGLEINPATFGTDRWLYIMHTSPSDNRIVRIKYDPVADSLQTGTLQVLVSGNPDGSVPADNPFGNAVWTLGHRNIQGLAFDSQGRLWEQEFGNSIMDETNLIEKGGNYGWPSCEGTSGSCGGYIAPKRTYSVGSGSCSGITIVRNALYVACQKGERIYRAMISGSSLTDVRQFFNGTYGRLRTVEPAPDGGIWLATSNGGDKDSTPNNSNNRIFHVTVG